MAKLSVHNLLLCISLSSDSRSSVVMFLVTSVHEGAFCRSLLVHFTSNFFNKLFVSNVLKTVGLGEL